jgi:hypothetical protein
MVQENDITAIVNPDEYTLQPTVASSIMCKSSTGKLTPVKKGDKVLDSHSIGRDSLRYGEIVEITEGNPTYGTLVIVHYDKPLTRKWKEDNGTIHEEVDEAEGMHVISEGGLRGRLIKIVPTQADVDKEKAALKAKTKKPSPKAKP